MREITENAATGTSDATGPGTGMRFDRVLSKDGLDPFDAFGWKEFTAEIKDDSGKVVFRQEDVDAPAGWSQLAVNVVANKYFYGEAGTGKRETGVRAMVSRVCRFVTTRGLRQGVFASDGDAARFHDELVNLLLGQYGSFNSPVWFNAGVGLAYGAKGGAENWRWSAELGKSVPCEDTYEWPQTSACFLQGVEDSIDGIMALAASEARLFKYGSGTGTSLSTLRSSKEKLSGGGKPSGPVSFLRIYDAVAGQIKSGGRSRRAARLNNLSSHHPDVMEFVRCKAAEEKKAHDLVALGYGGGIDGEAYTTVAFQNTNLSVAATNPFMAKAAGDDPDPWYDTVAVTTGEPVERLNAASVLDEVAEAAHACGDPGLQYIDTINEWHTCPNTGPITTSNPCCFVGSTLVETSEGKISIGRLAEMDAAGEPLPYAIGFDLTTGLPVLRKIKRAWVAGESTRMVEVTTDKGLSFLCTPEHEFLTHSGTYVPAAELKPGQRLRKVNKPRNTRRSDRRWLYHKVTPQAPSGCTVFSRWMWEQVNGPIPDGMEVHHKNEDPTDDRVSNFELHPIGEHQSYHSTGVRNANAVRCDERLLVEVWEAIEAAPVVYRTKGPKVTMSRWNKYIRDNGLVGKVPLSRCQDGVGLVRGLTWPEFAAWVESNRVLTNDRVSTVTPIPCTDGPVKVYDIEVEGIHNFSISDATSDHGIVVSNSEFVFLDSTSCNLFALNLEKFVSQDGRFDVDLFRHAVRVSITAQEILVDAASYPTEAISATTHRFRPLGLGPCGVGALAMAYGVPYDSDDARALAGSVQALMHGQALLTSAELAKHLGAFDGYAANEGPMTKVVEKHWQKMRDFQGRLSFVGVNSPADPEARWVIRKALECIEHAHVMAARYGYRNAQLTLCQPCGTISFQMDQPFTGIEPAVALVTYKALAGGGNLKLTVPLVRAALKRLGYSDREGNDAAGRVPSEVDLIADYVERYDTIEGCPELMPEHLPVFDCAFPPDPAAAARVEAATGVTIERRSIHWRGHVKMMAALQPFISGSQSKTINFPNTATPSDIREAYVEAWRLGLKSLAVYRDGSKAMQPVSTKRPEAEAVASEDEPRKEVNHGTDGQPVPNTHVNLSDFEALYPGVVLAPADDSFSAMNHATEARRAAIISAKKETPNGSANGVYDVHVGLQKTPPLVPGPVGPSGPAAPARTKLPATRESVTHHAEIGGHDLYIVVGKYPDGRPGELFLTMAKEGSTVGGLMDILGTSISIGLQHGVPLETYVNKFKDSRFEPAGFTRNPDVPIAKSLADYIFRWLGIEFIPGFRAEHAPDRGEPDAPESAVDLYRSDLHVPVPILPSERDQNGARLRASAPANRPPTRPRVQTDAPTCGTCGAIMRRAGSCYVCPQCGTSSGCG